MQASVCAPVTTRRPTPSLGEHGLPDRCPRTSRRRSCASAARVVADQLGHVVPGSLPASAAVVGVLHPDHRHVLRAGLVDEGVDVRDDLVAAGRAFHTPFCTSITSSAVFGRSCRVVTEAPGIRAAGRMLTPNITSRNDDVFDVRHEAGKADSEASAEPLPCWRAVMYTAYQSHQSCFGAIASYTQ